MSFAAPISKALSRRLTPTLFLWLVPLVVALLPGLTRSQEFGFAAGTCFPAPPAEDSGAVVLESPTEALSAVEVLFWSERDGFCLSLFSDSLRDGGGIPAVRAGLATQAPQIRNQASQRTLEVLFGYSTKELAGTRERWTSYETMVKEWSAVMVEELGTSSAMRADVGRMRARWAATAEATTSDSTLATVQVQVTQLLLDADRVADSLALAQSDMLALSGVVGEMDGVVRGVLERIDQAQVEARTRLFQVTRPPLFSHLLQDGNASTFLAEARLGGQDRVAFIVDWLRMSTGTVIVDLILILLLAWFARVVSLAVARVSDADPVIPDGDDVDEAAERENGGHRDVGDDLDAAMAKGGDSEDGAGQGGVGEGGHYASQEQVVLRAMGSHSLSAGYVLSLLFVPFLYAESPLLVRDLILLMSTVPLIILLRANSGRPARRIATNIALLYGVYSGLLLFLPNTPIRRAVVFLAAVLGYFLVRSVIRWYRTFGGDSWRRGASFFLPPMRVGFLVGAVAEFVGLAGLAEMLVTGLIALLFLGLLLRVLSLAVVGILMAVPATAAGGYLRGLRNHGPLIAGRLRGGAAVMAVLIWLWAAAQVFGISTDMESAFDWLFGAGISLGSLDLALGDILGFFFTVWVAFHISRFVRFVLEEEVFPRADLPKGVPTATSSLVHYVILSIGAVLALSVSGIDLDRIALLVSALGVGIGFGLQGVVGNFVAGLILLFERPVTVGDTVEVGALMGRVTRVGMRASTVRTYDGAEVIVPNMDLTAGQVINWTLSDRTRRVEVMVGVKYGTDPERVIEVLRKVAQGHPEVLHDPEPIVLFGEFGDSSLNFNLRCWIADFDRGLIVRSELTVYLNRLLAEAGIEIPFPQRDLHLRSVEGEAGLALAGGSSESASSRVVAAPAEPAIKDVHPEEDK